VGGGLGAGHKAIEELVELKQEVEEQDTDPIERYVRQQAKLSRQANAPHATSANSDKPTEGARLLATCEGGEAFLLQLPSQLLLPPLSLAQFGANGHKALTGRAGRIQIMRSGAIRFLIEEPDGQTSIFQVCLFYFFFFFILYYVILFFFLD
jgi:hypothetical protein